MESVYTIDGVNAQLNSFLTRLTLQQWQQKKITPNPIELYCLAW